MLEEFLADAYAGINAFGAHAERYQGAVESAMDELYMGKARNQDNGTRQTNGPNENTAGSGGVKYSLCEFEDGTRYVDVQMDAHTFDGMSVADMNRTAKQILMQKFAGKVIGIDNRVFVNGDSVNEYLHPSKSISADIRQAKLTASGELDNLVDAGRPLPNQPDGMDGHVHPGVTDFSYLQTIFKVGKEYFEGIVNIENIKRGRKLKDITKIRNITKDIVSSYGTNPKSNFLRDASMDSIRNPEKKVNSKFSASDSSYEDSVKEGADNSEEWVSVFDLPFNEQMEAMAQGRYDNETKRVRLNKPAQTDTQKANSQAVEDPVRGKRKFSADDTVSDNPYAGRSMTRDGKIYSYDFLTTLPDMSAVYLPEVHILQNQGGQIDTRKVVDEGMKNAHNVGVERDGKVFVRNGYTGNLLRIDNESIRHGLNGSYNRLLTNARLGAVIGNVVQNAVPINAMHNKAQGVSGTYAMAGYATDSNGREFVAIVTVEQRDGNISGIEVYDVAHAVSGRQKNRSVRVDTKSQGVYPSTNASKISIADFLNVVKSTHQSILSEDVLTSLGESRNPQGFYASKVKYSTDDLSAMEEELQMRESQQFQDRLMEDGGSAAWVKNQKRIEVLRQQMKRDPETIFRCVMRTTVCAGMDSRKCRKF